MKKILYVITKSNWGGAQTYVYDLATHLPPEAFDTVVACGGNGLLVERLKEAGIRVIPIPTLQRDLNLAKELASFFSLIKIFLREKADVIHLNSSKVGGLGAVAAFAAKLLTFDFKLLTVFTAHGWGFQEDRPWFERAIIFFLSWLSTLFQGTIIVIDTADYRSAQKFVPERKLLLIPHGIQPIDFLPRQDARAFVAGRINHSLGATDVLIGTIAELTKNKGLGDLIDAANILKFKIRNSKFEIIVFGDGEDRENLLEHIRSRGLTDTVLLLGFVPGAARYLKALDLFVLPSVKEGLPYTVMEAMAAGVPIVATRVGGIPDLIDTQRSGLLVPPKNPQALAEAIAAIITHPDRARTMAGAAQRNIEEHFRMGAMLERTIGLYHGWRSTA